MGACAFARANVYTKHLRLRSRAGVGVSVRVHAETMCGYELSRRRASTHTCLLEHFPVDGEFRHGPRRQLGRDVRVSCTKTKRGKEFAEVCTSTRIIPCTLELVVDGHVDFVCAAICGETPKRR